MLLQHAEERGLVAENGLWRLVAQAKESAEWFTGRAISNDVIPTIHKQLRLQMENLVLIGMPGSGKSTIGLLLADRLGKTFVDADAEIVKAAGISIPDIFATSGEEGFRKLETAILTKLGKQSGLVIATGGGCITKEENYPLLHQNGTIIWLQRDLDKLPTSGRPLSQAGNLGPMYTVRRPLYAAFSDVIVDNNTAANETTNRILSLLNREV